MVKRATFICSIYILEGEIVIFFIFTVKRQVKKGTSFSLREWLTRDARGWRLIAGIVFFLILALFLHVREVRIEVLELGSRAKKYIVADVDFEFPDPDTLVILKQEAVRDLGTIEKIDPMQIRQQRNFVEQELINHPRLREKVSVTFEEIYKILNVTEELMGQSRFVNERTYRKIEELKEPLQNYYVITDENERASLTDAYWKDLSSKLTERFRFNHSAVALVIGQFREKKWRFEEDYDLEKTLRMVIEKKLPKRMTKVKAGRRIIEPGVTVTQRHLAMIQAYKKELNERRNLWQVQTVIASLLFSLLVVVIGAIYLYFYHPRFFRNASKLALYLTILTLSFAVAKFAEFVFFEVSTAFIDLIRYPVIVPFATVLIAVLINHEIALFSTFVLTVLFGLTLAVQHHYFLFINLIAGMTALLSTHHLSKRREIFVISFKVWLVTFPVIIGYHLSNNHLWSFATVEDIVGAGICLAGIAVLISILLPLLEGFFNVMTNITLMEFMDPNNKLLRRLVQEAPGTYQHSLIIGTLAEASALSIGANGLFCRVASLYHDVGKLVNPSCFTENQHKEFSVHSLLSPYESTQVILSHVSEGVSLASEHHLPKPFVDIIREHHGTSRVYYFYRKAVKEMDDDVSRVDETLFRYSGPKPRSKESAIIMICDTVEAASRSLEEVNEETVAQLVERLVDDRIDDGQFSDCDLTFKELTIVKNVIVMQICAQRHGRVKYPTKD